MELHTRYSHTMKDTITEAGIALIKRFVDSQDPQAQEWKALNPKYTRPYMPIIPDTWQWQWKVEGKADYTGTFPKRLTKYFWKEHALKCPDSFTKELGNLARQHSSDSFSYSFEFVNRFNWDAGDYADENSCYWTDRASARTTLEENDALAIRFYADEKGIGRAWIAQLPESRYIVFNGYGLETIKIAQIFSSWLKLSYRKIALSNHGDTGGTLYINNGGYVIGTLEQTAAMDSHDLGYDCYDCYTCDYCGNDMNEDESYSTPNGESYCQSCFYDHYDYCAICDRTSHRDDMTYIDDRDICDSCFNSHYFECKTCHQYRPNRLAVDDENYCMLCKPDESEKAQD